jgi:hypothetical protein
MTEYYPDDYTNDGQPQDSQLVKDLRAQIKKANDDLKAARDTIDNQGKAIRERTVADVLSTKGVPAKVARLIPSDIEASEAAVSKWLEDYSDLFQAGSKSDEGSQNPPNQAGGSDNAAPTQDELAAKRMQNAMTGGTVAQPRMDELMEQVSKASPAELLAMIEASKRGG